MDGAISCTSQSILTWPDPLFFQYLEQLLLIPFLCLHLTNNFTIYHIVKTLKFNKKEHNWKDKKRKIHPPHWYKYLSGKNDPNRQWISLSFLYSLL